MSGRLRQWRCGAVVLACLLAAGSAAAACRHPAATDGPATCLSAADAEIARARQAALDRDPALYQRNAQRRCEALQGDDRSACVARMAGQGSRSGSVAGGGISRELVSAVPAASAPASAAAAAASAPR